MSYSRPCKDCGRVHRLTESEREERFYQHLRKACGPLVVHECSPTEGPPTVRRYAVVPTCWHLGPPCSREDGCGGYVMARRTVIENVLARYLRAGREDTPRPWRYKDLARALGVSTTRAAQVVRRWRAGHARPVATRGDGVERVARFCHSCGRY